ncbi:MAG: helix-turn-helix transcriptional regulator [Bacteroidota bacterium]
MKQKGLGEFEELVLLAVCILEGKAYGISVKEEIEQHTGRTILLGAVHITLYRLQDKGLLQSELAGQTAKRGGRKKRLFEITEAGMKQLRKAQEVRRSMWQLIPQLKINLS